MKAWKKPKYGLFSLLLGYYIVLNGHYFYSVGGIKVKKLFLLIENIII